MDKIIKHYDEVAERYDEMYGKPEDRAMDRKLITILKSALKPGEKILDLGCGTGFFLDHIRWPPEAYLGVDPSRRMCERLKYKHPGHAIRNSYLTSEIVCEFNPGLIIGLYAVGDYLDQKDTGIVVRSDYFMMFSHGNITDPGNPLFQNQIRQRAMEINQRRLIGARQVFEDSYLIISSRLAAL